MKFTKPYQKRVSKFLLFRVMLFNRGVHADVDAIICNIYSRI